MNNFKFGSRVNLDREKQHSHKKVLFPKFRFSSSPFTKKPRAMSNNVDDQNEDFIVRDVTMKDLLPCAC